MGLEPFPSVADALYLGGLVLMAIAIIGLLHDRIPGGDRAGLIDALIVAVGAGLVSWTFIMEPLVSDPAASMGRSRSPWRTPSSISCSWACSSACSSPPAIAFRR